MKNQNLLFEISNTNTIFSKKLSLEDRQQLHVPSQFFKNFLANVSPQSTEERALQAHSLIGNPPPISKWDFTAFDNNGEEWNFDLCKRHNGFGRLQGKWRAFVKRYGLDGNDGYDYGVIFYIDHNQPDRMQVRGLKKVRETVNVVRIMGVPIWDWETVSSADFSL